MAAELSWRQSRALGMFIRRFPQVHLGIGLLGNAVFIVGTVMYLSNRDDIGIWFFLVGSCGMFLGSLGEVFRIKGKQRLWQSDIDPVNPAERWSETGRSSSTLE